MDEKQRQRVKMYKDAFMQVRKKRPYYNGTWNPVSGDENAGAVTVANDRQQKIEQKEREKELDYAKRREQKRRDILMDPAKIAEQKRTNERVKAQMQLELMRSRRDHEAADVGTLMDYSGDYIPVDDEIRTANRRRKIRNLYQKKNPRK